jgi:hypothetical protein
VTLELTIHHAVGVADGQGNHFLSSLKMVTLPIHQIMHVADGGPDKTIVDLAGIYNTHDQQLAVAGDLHNQCIAEIFRVLVKCLAHSQKMGGRLMKVCG